MIDVGTLLGVSHVELWIAALNCYVVDISLTVCLRTAYLAVDLLSFKLRQSSKASGKFPGSRLVPTNYCSMIRILFVVNYVRLSYSQFHNGCYVDCPMRIADH